VFFLVFFGFFAFFLVFFEIFAFFSFFTAPVFAFGYAEVFATLEIFLARWARFKFVARIQYVVVLDAARCAGNWKVE
jgi:hypothetical protein